MVTQQHVVIVGGGLIGLSTAFFLLEDGHSVTIIEREELGAGAATGNAGELTPQQVAPLASPNTARDVLRGVFTRSAYLSIDPTQLPALAGFGLSFLRASRARNVARGAAALAQFSGLMLPSLARMGEAGIDISGGGQGFLMTSSDPAHLAAAHAGYQRRADLGWGDAPGPILRGTALRELEPALHEHTTGGFALPGEFSLDPVTFVASLAEHIRAAGAQVLSGWTAERVDAGTHVVCRGHEGEQRIVTGDTVVIAAGAWTTPLLRASRIPGTRVVPGKGYSFTVPVDKLPGMLVHSMDLHCVAVPMHGRLRIVGMMEFDNRAERLNRDRIDVLVRAASRLIAGAHWGERTDEWVGARPMTADGLPMLGPVTGHPGVFVAAGHNMHGLSLGPATGQVIADLVARREPAGVSDPLDLAPFAVRRARV